MRKIVAITQRVEIISARNERRDALDQRWVDYLSACSLTAFPIANRPDLAGGMMDRIDPAGLVLTGGNDLANYGGDAPERDATERQLIAWARTRRRPILAVCRGMQMLADVFGAGLARASEHAGRRHQIVLDAGATRDVNSYHNWTVSLPMGFRSWAMAEDGTIEAMRHSDEPITGILWHPEREVPFHKDDIALFRDTFGVVS